MGTAGILNDDFLAG